MTVETTEAVGITAGDIKALKCADGVTFHSVEGVASIRAHKRDRGESNGWSGTGDRTYEVSASEYWTDYGRSYGQNGAGEYKYAFASVSGSEYSQVWPSIASLLRVGDALTLHWIADNNSETIDKAGLHSDELRLEISRASLKRPLVFTVETSICPDNSARMVRRNRGF